jgi:Ulp1 family protease
VVFGTNIVLFIKASPMCPFDCRYLVRKLSLEERARSYFFNSFFFTKFLGNNSASTNIHLCEVEYEQVRNWTRRVNIFEKDYIFIPIVKR